MSAVLPRSKSNKQPKLARKSEESCKKKTRQISSGGFQHSLSSKSPQELSQTGSHVSGVIAAGVGAWCHELGRPASTNSLALSCLQPWSGFAEAVLRPLPADWRYNIEQAFSNIGDALGKLLGGGQQGQRVSLASGLSLL